MAYINKVVYGGNTLIDLTEDTVTSDTIAVGYKAHDRSGNSVTGTYTSDATASASNILSGKTAYVNGEKIIGTAKVSVSGITLIMPSGLISV